MLSAIWEARLYSHPRGMWLQATDPTAYLLGLMRQELVEVEVAEELPLCLSLRMPIIHVIPTTQTRISVIARVHPLQEPLPSEGRNWGGPHSQEQKRMVLVECHSSFLSGSRQPRSRNMFNFAADIISHRLDIHASMACVIITYFNHLFEIHRTIVRGCICLAI